MPSTYPRIPYGEADFRRIRLNRWLYVDKTRFVRRLEDERYVFFIRPRRFGKSCWLSLLENYYDRRWADEFEAVFGGTDIGREPTTERHRYVVLRFDFSMVRSKLSTLEGEFEAYCDIELGGTLRRHPDLFAADTVERILARPSIAAKLAELFLLAGDRGIPLYAMVDEYDNFANTVLAHHGEEAYQSLTHGSGFYRDFFAVLKGATGRSGGGLERLFITGVSPVTMDDVTSGFNIGKNISLEPDFNELLGFTAAEVRDLVATYHDRGAFSQDPGEALALMGQWYNGYRFARAAEVDVYNTDMVLYYLDRSIPNRGVPDHLIDTNVRIDYGKLRHLLVTGRRLNGNFDLLRQAIADGEADTRIEAGFPLEHLNRRENFLSLMHFFGLLSIRGAREGVARLGIPNQTVKHLMHGYLRDAWQEMGLFAVDFYALERLLGDMAYRGAWRPLVEHLAEAMARQTGIRNYIEGERTVQAFFAAYLGMTDHFVLHSERELGKGYADLHLEPLTARHPGARRGYLIEFKYFKRRDKLPAALAERAAAEAHSQLRRYLADDALRRDPAVSHTGIALVFNGWELALGTEHAPAN